MIDGEAEENPGLLIDPCEDPSKTEFLDPLIMIRHHGEGGVPTPESNHDPTGKGQGQGQGHKNLTLTLWSSAHIYRRLKQQGKKENRITH